MNQRNEIKNQLVAIKKKLEDLDTKEAQLKSVMIEKAGSEQAAKSLLELYKIMLDENKTTREMLRMMSGTLANVQASLAEIEYPEEVVQELNAQPMEARAVPISDVDRQIIQAIQHSPQEMACASDIQKVMSYRGKNAASARLNRLCTLGLLERYRMGHRVYYKFDAGKTTKMLIVSPPQ